MKVYESRRRNLIFRMLNQKKFYFHRFFFKQIPLTLDLWVESREQIEIYPSDILMVSLEFYAWRDISEKLSAYIPRS